MPDALARVRAKNIITSNPPQPALASGCAPRNIASSSATSTRLLFNPSSSKLASVRSASASAVDRSPGKMSRFTHNSPAPPKIRRLWRLE